MVDRGQVYPEAGVPPTFTWNTFPLPTRIVNTQKHRVMGKLCFNGHFSRLDKFEMSNVIKK